jgi:hypothetical protein
MQALAAMLPNQTGLFELARPQPLFECAVSSFNGSLSLWMVGPAVDYTDA